jgi:hypothetical protein
MDVQLSGALATAGVAENAIAAVSATRILPLNPIPP